MTVLAFAVLLLKRFWTGSETIQDSHAVIHHVGTGKKIEELHREVKQVTAIEKCQCRKARAQRNHIACAMMA
jgi:hypothetical protein